MTNVEIFLFLVGLFAVPAALLYLIERFESGLRRAAPGLFSRVLVGLRPLHIMGALAGIGGLWLSWANWPIWELWQLVLAPVFLVAIVYAAPVIGILFVNPASVGQLGVAIIRRAYKTNDRSA
jgi:hypothetical protein